MAGDDSSLTPSRRGMSRSGRRRDSKWDSKEASKFALESFQDDGWPRESDLSFHARESLPGHHASEVAGLKDRKWGLQKNGSTNKGCSDFFQGSMEWERDGSYSMKMSPGLDGWREQRRTFSPKSYWNRAFRGRNRSRSKSRSKSRSRSPGRVLKRELSMSDRSSSRSGVLSQPCRDFVSGRCRRGDHCLFPHHCSQDYTDRRQSEGGVPDSRESRPRNSGALKYSTFHDVRDHPTGNARSVEYCDDFLKGRCRKGDSCMYVHHSVSYGLGRDDRNELFRERVKDRRNRDTFSESMMFERESRRSGNIPCKFYASGNCRNGKHCRFSHDTETHPSSEGRPREAGRVDRNFDNVEQLTTSHNVLDSVNFPEVKYGRKVASEIWPPLQSRDDLLGCGLDVKKEMVVSSTYNDKAIEHHENGLISCKTENRCSILDVPKCLGTEKWLGEVDNSPAQNYIMKSPNETNQKELDYAHQNSDSLAFSKPCIPAHENNITEEASSPLHVTPTLIQPLTFEKSLTQQIPSSSVDNPIGFPSGDRNAVGSSASLCLDLKFSSDGMKSSTQPPPSLNVVAQSPLEISPRHARAGNVENSHNLVQFPGGESKKPVIEKIANTQITSEILRSQNIVSGEQLVQLTNLSASLAQILGSGQQFHQLYAALNSASGTALIPTPSAGPVKLVSSTTNQPNVDLESHKKCDPTCDSIDLIKPGGPTGGNSSMTERSEDLNRVKPVADCEAHESNRKVVKEVLEDKEEAQEDGLLSNMDGNGKGDECKKNKEAKGIRMFKFALVESVKEILKPTWKDGHINKDVHKNIVKKVVDKVISTMQESQVPQTEEKINQYLSLYKQKITKLVQAYVAKHQKS